MERWSTASFTQREAISVFLYYQLTLSSRVSALIMVTALKVFAQMFQLQRGLATVLTTTYLFRKNFCLNSIVIQTLSGTG